MTIEQIIDKRAEKKQESLSKKKHQAVSDKASPERRSPQEEEVLYADASDEQDFIPAEKPKHYSIDDLNKIGRFEQDSKVIMQSFGSQS